ncbi:MAG: purine-nucleoside phosphorylase [Bacillota bacterium]
MGAPTPHNSAKPGDIAKTVLMPGDPLRAQYIAANYLQNAVLVNNVRGIQGYTGEYRGKRVSVMASGMGIPSMSIYSYELFYFYDVDNIIRIGSAGALQDGVELRSIVLGMGACTDSNAAAHFKLPGTFAPIASYGLLHKAVEAAKDLGIPVRVGNLFSADIFYDDLENLRAWGRMGVLAVEMETAGLYLNAAEAGKNALSIVTVSDRPLTGEACTVEERQTGFTRMMELALAIA